jgi:hypothetical protein
MALTITSANTQAWCTDHRRIVVDDEGVTREFVTTLEEVDQMIADLGGTQKAKKTLVLLWAAYRRSQGRAVTGVAIA